jgi:hypothetical protein
MIKNFGPVIRDGRYSSLFNHDRLNEIKQMNRRRIDRKGRIIVVVLN